MQDSDELDRLPAPARAIAVRLGMRKIPHEGAWFVESYRSEARASAPPGRAACTAIQTLLTRESFSALHRLASDELWLFHAGAPLELFTLDADGQGATITLGTDLLAGERCQHLVPRGTWMAARPLEASPDAWTLIGNVVAPGFEYADYEPGRRDALVAAFPEHAALVAAFTRG